MLLLSEEQQREVIVEDRPLVDFKKSAFRLTDALLCALSRHSLLYTIRACLPALRIDEIKEIIDSHPGNTHQAAEEKERDSVVITGYYVLRSILSLFLQFHERFRSVSPPDTREDKNDSLREMEARMEEELGATLTYLGEVQSVHYKLVLLEDIYCLLFLNTHHLTHIRDVSASRTSLSQPSTKFPTLPMHAPLTNCTILTNSMPLQRNSWRCRCWLTGY